MPHHDLPRGDRIGQIRETEKQVQKRVKAMAALLGFHVSDFSQPRASMQTPGICDLYVVHPGKRIRAWVEVKAPRGTLSAAQVEWQKRVQAAGGRVWVVRSAEDFAAFASTYGVER